MQTQTAKCFLRARWKLSVSSVCAAATPLSIERELTTAKHTAGPQETPKRGMKSGTFQGC